MIMQVIGLSLYVVLVAMSSTASNGALPVSLPSSPVFSYLIVFVLLPGISFLLLYVMDKVVFSTLVGAKDILMKGMYFSGIAIGAFVVLMATGVLQKVIDPAYALPIFLIAASALPAYRGMKLEKNMKGMESELPSYLRDVAESRKAGLSPEKCIVYASERIRDSVFQGVVKSFANQLEWGVPLRKIYENLASSVKSFSALIHFRVLIEAIESGGGYTTSLEILAQSSESSYNIEREKSSMLKPYFFIAFMVTALTSVTTLMVAQTFDEIGGSILAPGAAQGAAVEPEDTGEISSTQMLAIGIAGQSWMSGFLIGKISSGSFATGFKYAIMLLVISTLATVMTQEFNLSPSAFLNSPTN
jgi:flagellar protein FlaJ